MKVVLIKNVCYNYIVYNKISSNAGFMWKNIVIGGIHMRRKTIISANPLLQSSTQNENLSITPIYSPHKKRSTLKELCNLANRSKDIKIRNLITLINSKPEDNYKIKALQLYL